MIAKNTNIFDESPFAHLKQTLPPNDYQSYINFKKREEEMNEYQEKERIDGRRKKAGQDFYTRKDSLILRGVKKQKREQEFVTDDDTLACCDIHKMIKARKVADGTYIKGTTKIEVTDEEIKAFRDLENDGHYFNDITLEMIESKVNPEKDTKDKAKKDVSEPEVAVTEDGKVLEITEYTVEDETLETSAFENEVTEEDVPDVDKSEASSPV